MSLDCVSSMDRKKEFLKQHAYLDIVERKQSDHGVVLPFVPIFVDLFPHEYDVTFPERQFSIHDRTKVFKTNTRTILYSVLRVKFLIDLQSYQHFMTFYRHFVSSLISSKTELMGSMMSLGIFNKRYEEKT